MSRIVERRSSVITKRAKQEMQDVSPNIHQAVVPSIHPEKNLPSGNTVHQFPKVDKWKVPSTYKIWELSERALKKHDIID